MLASTQKTTHTAELNLLHRAASGDKAAMHEVIQFLSSANPYLRQIMKDTLHKCCELEVWLGLVRCFGEHCWHQEIPEERLSDPDAAQRLDETIVQAFVDDIDSCESDIKHQILHQALDDSLPGVRYASAYLLGVRCDPAALPVLAEVLQFGNVTWKVRAVQALAMINVPECGPLLVQGLASKSKTLHRAASDSLDKIVPTVRATLVEAMDHPDPHVRWHVARMLVTIGDTRGINRVVEGLSDENRTIRNASAEALARFGPPSVPHLLRVLCSPDLNQQTMRAVAHAINSINSFTVRDRLHPLLKALQDPATNSTVASIAQQMLRESKVSQ